MSKQEKKYRVGTFASIKRQLRELNAPKIRTVVSTHYYGQHNGNNVDKFVEYSDRVEVRAWQEIDGKFAMTEQKRVSGKEQGIDWLKNRGYITADIVKMAYTEYEYKSGIVGLYIIDDFLHSVILDYPPNQHALIEKELGLDNAEVITIPYNKLLKKIGRLRSMEL